MMLKCYPQPFASPWSDETAKYRRRRRKRLADSWPDSPPSPYGVASPLNDLDNNKEVLGQYIHRIYCRECREQERMASGSSDKPNSPPQYQMDQLSLASTMDANRESLKRKLMLRRSMNELVDQGILPSLNAPAAYAEQMLHLQRAQTTDLLNKKIQMRPDRQFLVQHHILDDSHVDPSLVSRQRQLKKARLTDELNEKIAHRPGPLELVEQHILEADDPIKNAIQEGKIEYPKTEEGVGTHIPKLPYVIESPKSASSSPEPLDCDNESNSSSTGSTGFNVARIPSPPDIAPLLNNNIHHITIGGKTIPVTSQQAPAMQNTMQTVTVSQQLASTNILTSQPAQRTSSFGALLTRPAYRNKKQQNRNKTQTNKQRVIKFHEYKGPNTAPNNSSKNSYSASGSSFVTTNSPVPKLDGLTPYQVSVQQQQLYLQCQLEVQNPRSQPAVFVPIPAGSESEIRSPPLAMPMKSPPSVMGNMKSPPPSHTPLSTTRSVTNLEDMKVTTLRTELKNRSLPISGSKPQLIERLRNYLTSNANDTGNFASLRSEVGFYSNMPSVQSQSSDDTSLTTPHSVISRTTSPPQSPLDESMRSPPPSVASILSPPPSVYKNMETEDNGQQARQTQATVDIVREQQRTIEELQRALMQSQQQLQLVQQPFVLQSPPAQSAPAQPVPEPERPDHLNQQTPVDITDKQVYLATPDGKMTAFKVVLHTGNGIVQQMIPATKSDSQPQLSPVILNVSESQETSPSIPLYSNTPDHSPVAGVAPVETDDQDSIDVDDVLEVLIRTGEMDPQVMMSPPPIRNSLTMTEEALSAFPNQINGNPGDDSVARADLHLHQPLSPLVNMDWMDSDPSQSTYLDNIPDSQQDMEQSNLDWLSNVMQLQEQQNNLCDDSTLTLNAHFSGDPVLTPKPQDVLKIFDMEESDFKTPEHGSGINWDTLMGQASTNHL